MKNRKFFLKVLAILSLFFMFLGTQGTYAEENEGTINDSSYWKFYPSAEELYSAGSLVVTGNWESTTFDFEAHTMPWDEFRNDITAIYFGDNGTITELRNAWKASDTYPLLKDIYLPPNNLEYSFDAEKYSFHYIHLFDSQPHYITHVDFESPEIGHDGTVNCWFCNICDRYFEEYSLKELDPRTVKLVYDEEFSGQYDAFTDEEYMCMEFFFNREDKIGYISKTHMANAYRTETGEVLIGASGRSPSETIWFDDDYVSRSVTMDGIECPNIKVSLDSETGNIQYSLSFDEETGTITRNTEYSRQSWKKEESFQGKYSGENNNYYCEVTVEGNNVAYSLYDKNTGEKTLLSNGDMENLDYVLDIGRFVRYSFYDDETLYYVNLDYLTHNIYFYEDIPALFSDQELDPSEIKICITLQKTDYSVTWNWSEDLSSATALFTCADDQSLNRIVDAEITIVESDFGISYVATVTFLGKEYTDTVFVMKEKTVVRIYGENRYETSLKTAEELRSVLGVDKFDAVVLTTGSDFADALSGSYLANKNKAPVILIRQNSKSIPYADNVINYIKEHVKDGGKVYVLGGVNAVPEEWLTGLAGYKVTRLEGSNRYTTNIEVLNEVGYEGGDILVCTGKDFADSLSASAVDLPILLVNGTGNLSKTQKTYLESLSNVKFHIIGGEAAVSKDIETALASYGTVAERIAGGARYETSKLIAERFFSEPDKAVLAYGHNFPDGLGGGALAYALKSPLILAGSSKSRSRYAIEYCTGKGITSGYVLGGSGLISDDYVRQIFSIEDDLVIIEK